MIRAVLVAVTGAAGGGAAAVLVLRRMTGVRGQVLVLAVTASLLPAAAVVLAGLVMFSAHDVGVLAVIAVASVASAGVPAALIAARIARGVTRVHGAAERLAAGDLSARAAPDGPREVRELAEAFNEMAARLDRLFETRRNLVAWASHDLRAPLASLQAMIEALEDGLAAPDQYLPAMRSQVRMLTRLVDDLFELSRIETGTLALAFLEVRVPDLAAECVHSMRPEAERRRVRVELVDGSGGAAIARCDPDKIERVLLNLLSNALRHTPHDGAVAVRVEGGSPSVRVAVEDTGEGLPPGAEERAFESFWRADASRSSATGGAGLGLAIARGLVEAHGGRIWTEPRPGGGARFVFTLPAAEPAAVARQA